MEESLFKNPALLGYLVKATRDKYPEVQIGKTVVQKLIFLLSRKLPVDFNYEMYHYGPYSNDLDSELRFAENSSIIKIDWNEDYGFFIEPTDETNKFINLIKKEEKAAIDDIVNKYGKFRAKELAIITTALYLRDNYHFKDDKLPGIVHQLKQSYTEEEIKKILQRAGIIK